MTEKNKKRTWIRGVLAVLFIGSLCFFLQFKGVQGEFIELHSLSKQYIVAQISFEVPDEDRRFLLQQQAIEGMGPIYAFEYRQVHHIEENFFAYLAQNVSLQQKLIDIPKESLRTYIHCVEEFISDSRFTNIKTLEVVEHSSLTAHLLHLFVLSSENIPSAFWEALQRISCDLLEEDSTMIRESVVGFLMKQEWSLQQDAGLERRIHAYCKAKVPEQYRQIRKGTFLVEPGEEITEQHLRMLQAMRNAQGSFTYRTSLASFLGNLSLSLIVGWLTVLYLRTHHEHIYRSLRKLTLLLVIVILTLVLARAIESLVAYRSSVLIETLHVPLVVPFASLLICVLLGARIALFSAIFLSVVVSLSISVEYDRFLVLNLLVSLGTILCAKSLHRRKEIFEVCAKVWLYAIPVLIAFHLKENTLFNPSMLFDLGMTFISMMLSALIVVGLLPLLEISFHIMTDMSLMEYMDPNNELLRRLSVEAPGTYQHSLVVGNLAEVGARAIGAHDLFCRVAALYHDIGKLAHPHYFTENQQGGFNIHQLLTPKESTQVILSHVTEGENIAKRYGLPKSFIDIIKEHHGTTLVYFFYCKQIEQMEGDPSRVPEQQFRYLGPKPRSKESALLMIADTIEAASRSLEEVTEEVLVKMIDRLIMEKSQEGQFDDCIISFKELILVKKAMAKAILLSRHVRIKYPEKESFC